MKIRIGTRGSKLALIQTEYVKNRLKEAFPENEYEIVVIKTKGDLIQDKPLNEIGSKGLFVNEIEAKLLNNEIQLAVHSMKDMPSELKKGLIFSRLWKREDNRDVLVLREKSSLKELKSGAVIGTGSVRRARQLKRLREDISIVNIRGNVDTRLKKMEEQKLDGLVLAAAALKRLGLEEKITCYLEDREMIPAPAQGILALELKEDNLPLRDMLNSLYDFETDITGRAERAFLEEMGGDCHAPIGALCTLSSETSELMLKTVYGRKSGGELVFANVKATDPFFAAKSAAKSIRKQISGTVALVGAGPGDTGLITLKGKEEVEKADCILYDRLISKEILSWCKASCEMIYVGKENKKHTMKQEDINKLLIKKALEYDNVVRLKGGDPYVFGRGGEEALALKEAGVRFRVIPGVTSAAAAAAYAGIPITHRGMAFGVNIVTAHSKNNEPMEINFEAIVKSGNTNVFLMGLTRLGEIVHGLICAGMDRAIKAAVISCGTTAKQKTVVSSLENIEEEVRKEGVTSPAIIVVGKTVSLREKLNFFEENILYGKKYIVPKIGEGKSRLTSMLEKEGAFVNELKLGELEFISFDINKELLKAISWIVFTSRNGVDGFMRGLKANGLDIRAVGGCKFAVIGEKTAQRLEAYGIIADLKPTLYNSDSLLEALKNLPKASNKQGLLYPKAANAKNDILRGLEESFYVTELNVYENKPVYIAAVEEDFTGYNGIFFTCASLAERFFKRFGKDSLCNMTIVSIGKRCSNELKRHGIYDFLEAEKADYAQMVKAVKGEF